MPRSTPRRAGSLAACLALSLVVAAPATSSVSVRADNWSSLPPMPDLTADTFDYQVWLHRAMAPRPTHPEAGRYTGDTAVHHVTIAKVLTAGADASIGLADADLTARVALIDDFYRQRTGGAIGFTVTHVTDWVDTDADCGTPAMFRDVVNATGFERTLNHHLVAYIPGHHRDTGCGAAGAAETATSNVHGALAYASHPDFNVNAVAHLLGHNLGFGHAHSFTGCAAGLAEPNPMQPDTQYCTRRARSDFYDLMGEAWVGSDLNQLTLSPQHQRVAGRPVPEPITTPTDVVLRAADLSADDHEQQVAFIRAGDHEYSLQYTPAGKRNTSWPRFGLGTGGLLVRRTDERDTRRGVSTILLDAGRAKRGNSAAVRDRLLQHGDGALTLGNSHSSVEVLDANADRALIRVIINSRGPAAPPVPLQPAAPEPTTPQPSSPQPEADAPEPAPEPSEGLPADDAAADGAATDGAAAGGAAFDPSQPDETGWPLPPFVLAAPPVDEPDTTTSDDAASDDTTSGEPASGDPASDASVPRRVTPRPAAPAPPTPAPTPIPKATPGHLAPAPPPNPDDVPEQSKYRLPKHMIRLDDAAAVTPKPASTAPLSPPPTEGPS